MNIKSSRLPINGENKNILHIFNSGKVNTSKATFKIQSGEISRNINFKILCLKILKRKIKNNAQRK